MPKLLKGYFLDRCHILLSKCFCSVIILYCEAKKSCFHYYSVMVPRVRFCCLKNYFWDHHRLVRHPNSIQASTNQSQGRGSILLPPWTAALPRLDAGSGGVKPTSNCIIQNLQTMCRMMMICSCPDGRCFLSA